MRANRTKAVLPLLLLALILAAQAGRGAAPVVLAGPFLTDLTPTSAGVTWLSDVPATAAVEWNDATGGVRRAVASTDGLVEAGVRIHRIPVEGLEPDQAYRMRAVTRAVERIEPYSATFGSETNNGFELRTPAAARDRIRLAILNDLHAHEPLVRRMLGVATAGDAPDGVIFNGDVVADPRVEARVTGPVLAPVTAILGTRVPAWFVRGNHETRGEMARGLGAYLLPAGVPWVRAFTIGPVRIVMLDSGEDKPDTDKAYSGLADFDRHRAAQAGWLAAEVAGDGWKKAAHRLVFSHIPPYSTDDAQSWHGPREVCARWAPVVLGQGVTAWFSGHTHRTEVVDPVPGAHDYPVFIGGGSQENAATVMRVEADASALTVTVLDADGKTLVRRELPVRPAAPAGRP